MCFYRGLLVLDLTAISVLITSTVSFNKETEMAESFEETTDISQSWRGASIIMNKQSNCC